MLRLLSLSKHPFQADLNDCIRPNFTNPQGLSFHNVLETLRGRSPQTKAQAAFAVLNKEIFIKQHWIKLLKSLIILDRLAEQGLFAHEIEDLVINFRSKLILECGEAHRQVLKRYWQIIQLKARILTTGGSIFCCRRNERLGFLTELTKEQMMQDAQRAEGIFRNLLLLAEKIGQIQWENQNNKDSISEYLCLRIFYKLLRAYGCQLLCLQGLMKMLTSLTLEQIISLANLFKVFNDNCVKVQAFVSLHKGTKGFDSLHIHNLQSDSNQEIVESLTKLIECKQQQAEQSKIPQLFVSKVIQVEKKPLTEISNDKTSPRVQMNNTNKRRLKRRETLKEVIEHNPFSDWSNSYSEQFPQKQVMALDLIQHLEEESQVESDVQNYDEEELGLKTSGMLIKRKTLTFSNKERHQSEASTIESTGMKSVEFLSLSLEKVPSFELSTTRFPNLFSRNKSKWNSS